MKSLSAILLASPLLSLNVSAAQLIKGSASNPVDVNVSANEQNKISILDGHISLVVPSSKNAISYVLDDATAGAMYFTFTDPAQTGTVTLFISDDENPNVSYRLILHPRSIAAEDVVIEPVKTKVATGVKTAGDGRALSYQRRTKEMFLALMDVSSDSDVVEVNQEIPLWKEGRLVMLSKISEGNLVGEKYRLTNISAEPMLLAEQELYRRGVVAVAIESLTVAPAASTLVLIVRGRKENE